MISSDIPNFRLLFFPFSSEAKKALDANSFQIKTISKDIADVRESLNASTAKLHADIKKELEGTRHLNEKIVGTINVLNRDLTEVKQDITGVKEQINLETMQLAVLKNQIDHALKREKERLEYLRIDSASADPTDDVKHWTDVPMSLIEPFNSLFVPVEYLAPPEEPKIKKTAKKNTDDDAGHPWTDFEGDIAAANGSGPVRTVDDKAKKPSWSAPVRRPGAQDDALPVPPQDLAAASRQPAGPKKVTVKVAYTEKDGLGMVLVNAEPGDFEGRKIARLRVKAFRANQSGGPSASELAGAKIGDILEQVRIVSCC